MVVDDEADIKDLAVQILSQYGYQTIQASSGEEALEIYRHGGRGIDLVILDLNMPGMGGHACLLELKAYDPQVKVLIASGYSINGQAKKTLESGALGFIAKPYRYTDLLGTVRSVLDSQPPPRTPS